MRFSIITGFLGIIMFIMCLGFNVSAAPKYVTQCKLYGNAGDAIECNLIPNPMHVAPSVPWSSYRMHREGLPPIKKEVN